MDNVYILGPDGELYHHGIKGQKWGVRRYQTESGGLTPAGRKRYSDDGGPQTSRQTTNRNRTGAYNNSSTPRKKSFEEVTMKDLQRQQNSERSRRRGQAYVEKYGKQSYKHATQKVTDKYKRIVQRQIENRIVSAVLNTAVEAARIGLPLLIAAL